MKKLFVGMVVVLVGFLAAEVAVAEKDTIVIAHRGASGYMPEHTLEAYKLAIEQGADYIEPDLVMTRDGHLVARHDGYLSTTTNVADHPEFADRKRTIQGKTDWFVFDFTLEELKTLRTKQPRVSRGKQFDGQGTIPTIDEIVALAEGYKGKRKPVGLHIEMKRPDAFKQIDSELDKTLAALFSEISSKDIPLFFQCFDGNFLLKVGEISDVPLVMLIGGKPNMEGDWYELDIALEPFAGRVAGFGLNKALLVNKDGSATDIIDRAHSMGAVVHVWTVRNDQLHPMFKTVEQELKALYSMGVDGVFTDFPDTAISVRNSLKLLEPLIAND
ncbi:hypothetical protein KFE96_10580 [Kordiimonas sp. SCSIO 12603]|uniref:glycerophosphodiester phosphodiesterase family protein n=1 Tax=Kordiimonas sp. SCSIO 12603 TaxID=2829596 RepID=UPI00210365CD|nr:glycerophosphodiester phosphodiesterase family protein [Kordiimonas sp. SCSIO 12603]UTW57302.1 hypothetical protein KFE96_10580 [Kordiimonas sp. SCSIO 12603]